MINVSDKSCREAQNTHFMFNSFFFFENRAVYEIMRKNKVELDRPQMTWTMRIACSIPKATNTHSDYVMRIIFSAMIMVEGTRLDVRLYVHCLSCSTLKQGNFRRRLPHDGCLGHDLIDNTHCSILGAIL